MYKWNRLLLWRSHVFNGGSEAKEELTYLIHGRTFFSVEFLKKIVFVFLIKNEENFSEPHF